MDAVRWGDAGVEHVYKRGDAEAERDSVKKAVAEGLARGDALMDEVDRSIARELQGQVGIAKDAGGGLILAYWPSAEVAAQLDELLPAGTPGKVATSDLHLTLVYLDGPEWAEEGSDWDVELLRAVTKLFSRDYYDINAKVGGLGRFVGPEDADVFVALIDSPSIADMREYLLDRLYCHGCIPGSAAFWSPQHGYIPHVTLAYVEKGAGQLPPLDADIEFKIDNITIAAGEARVRFELGYDFGSDEAEDSAAFYASRDAMKIAKAGRVLSEKNLEALETAMAAMGAVVEQERKRKRPEDEQDEAYMEKRREFLASLQGPEDGAPLEYAVTKADDEQRFTLGPLYAPDRKDAHGEYTDGDTLQGAVWDFVRQSRESGGRLNLQHGDLGDVTVAEMVEVMAWPYDHTIKVRTAGGDERELEMPAGTVYLGAIWDEDVWPLVKAGKLNGWSLGGKAVRVREGVSLDSLPHMGDKLLSRERR